MKDFYNDHRAFDELPYIHLYRITGRFGKLASLQKTAKRCTPLQYAYAIGIGHRQIKSHQIFALYGEFSQQNSRFLSIHKRFLPQMPTTP